MEVFHVTSREIAAVILEHGFEDGVGTFLTDVEWFGVWVSDRPLDVSEGVASMGAVLQLEIPVEVFEEYEWAEEGKGYREALIPSAILNTFEMQAFSHEDVR